MTRYGTANDGEAHHTMPHPGKVRTGCAIAPSVRRMTGFGGCGS